MKISVLCNHTISASNSMEFGIQSHWGWRTKSLGVVAKSMEIEIQPQYAEWSIEKFKKQKTWLFLATNDF